MTEIKQVNVSACSRSFHFFFSRCRWVFEWGGSRQVLLEICLYRSWVKGGRMRVIMLLLWNQMVCVREMANFDLKTSEVTKSEQFRAGQAGRGGCLYCYIIQCRFMSNITNTATQYMIHEEKERERMGIELNEQRGKKWIIHNSVGVFVVFQWRFCVGF